LKAEWITLDLKPYSKGDTRVGDVRFYFSKVKITLYEWDSISVAKVRDNRRHKWVEENSEVENVKV
jgi:hypothetical protein